MDKFFRWNLVTGCEIIGWLVIMESITGMFSSVAMFDTIDSYFDPSSNPDARPSLYQQGESIYITWNCIEISIDIQLTIHFIISVVLLLVKTNLALNAFDLFASALLITGTINVRIFVFRFFFLMLGEPNEKANALKATYSYKTSW